MSTTVLVGSISQAKPPGMTQTLMNTQISYECKCWGLVCLRTCFLMGTKKLKMFHGKKKELKLKKNVYLGE